MKLILASASPRRRELLAQAGLPFTVQTADIDESQRSGETAEGYTTRLALEKAQAVFNSLADTHDAVVLGADTTVALGAAMLGKPSDAADAMSMLRSLSGRAHSVVTGVALVSASRHVIHAEKTQVFFNAMSDTQIAAYVATGEPMDKAGAYAIQGGAARFIGRIEGDYANVVGLPLAVTCGLLADFGIV